MLAKLPQQLQDLIARSNEPAKRVRRLDNTIPLLRPIGRRSAIRWCRKLNRLKAAFER